MKAHPADPFKLAALIRTLYPQDAGIPELFYHCFRRSGFDRNRISTLIGSARNPTQSWEMRRIAVLMLEHEALLMWRELGFGEESDWFLGQVGLLVDESVSEIILREGYSTTKPGLFAAELRARLARLDRIHSRIHGWTTKPDAVRDFIHVAKLDSKLTLGRYLFKPEEAAQRIVEQVRTAPGLAASRSKDAPAPDTSHTAVFDQALIDLLRRDGKIFWVSPSTSSELNSLIEYPLGTVVMTIKPPGSDREFEIKRTGMRGAHVIDVLFEREGNPVPVSHRMQGTASGPALAFEDSAGRHFTSIYHAVHGVDPPSSRMLGYHPIANVANGGGVVHVLDYLSNPAFYGDDFARMRDHLKRCVAAYEGNEPRNELPGEFGWTMRFFNHVVPNQAWIEGSTSFRLDRIVKLLSADGPHSYFRCGLSREFCKEDERRLADEVLEEVLGVVHPPADDWKTYTDYVERTLAIPPNRASADNAYLDAVNETGRYWGTVLGTGGFSEGECFVTRNVGIKSCWQDGSWRPRIRFMDHDNLILPGGSIPDLARTIGGMRGDELWIRGDRDRSIMACLGKIYQPSTAMQRRGRNLLRSSIEKAFRATRRAMHDCETVRSLIREDYLPSLQRRDEVIRLYMATGDSKSAVARWRKQAGRMMADTVYHQASIPDFIDFVVRFRSLLRKYAFLFEEPDGSDGKELRDKSRNLG